MQHPAIERSGEYRCVAIPVNYISQRQRLHQWLEKRHETVIYPLFHSNTVSCKYERHGGPSEGRFHFASESQSIGSQLLQERHLDTPIARYCQTDCEPSKCGWCSSSFKSLVKGACQVWPRFELTVYNRSANVTQLVRASDALAAPVTLFALRRAIETAG